MIEIRRYNIALKTIWDQFVSNAKNGTFLLYRDYIEYHANRFEDHSLLFFCKNKLIAILPANLKDNQTLISHEGLTYGGLVMSSYTKTIHAITIFELLKNYMAQNKITTLIYKKLPAIYTTAAAEEDLYALFRAGAQLTNRSVSSCIYPQHEIKYSQLRQRCLNKAKKFDLQIRQNNHFHNFWDVLEANLRLKHKTVATHNVEEIEYLASKFPQNIILYEVLANDTLLGGFVLYKTDQVNHIQYIASTKEGRDIGALDFLFDRFIVESQKENRILDFGTSTENKGYLLNESLIAQKEGFGARAITYDTYQLNANMNPK